ncbi:MAG: 4-hydroxy-3-methylbut-2-enyl diphosphate reductase [Candidatus Cryptobacteroides sp.]
MESKRSESVLSPAGMNLSVEIEKHSGFCGGVIRAIGTAERYLGGNGGTLYSLGAIVHNEAELHRLQGIGLVSVSMEDIVRMDRAGKKASPLLIRAHGEPPSTYSLAEEAGIEIIDCTCPVVLRLQKNIKEAYSRLKPQGGQIIIFGKIGHAEVLGLVGQTGGEAIVVEDLQMLKGFLADGRIDTGKPLAVFSQTTKSPSEYSEICSFLRAATRIAPEIHETICSQVASRHTELASFALRHDVIVFVTGTDSSNGKVLSNLCRSHNPRTWNVTSPGEIDPSWFKEGERVGICGATSTPRWLLDDVARAVANL